MGGIVGYSSAYSLEESLPYLTEACAWLGQQYAQDSLKLAMLVGHWDTHGLGCDDDMAVPEFFDTMASLPGCRELNATKRLKFFMGHTHCNVPHPHGHMDTGFMVAGQGMEGCGNYGFPVIDTTDDRVRIWHFEVVSKNGTDSYDQVYQCLSQNESWRSCTHLAESWLDMPM